MSLISQLDRLHYLDHFYYSVRPTITLLNSRSAIICAPISLR